MKKLLAIFACTICLNGFHGGPQPASHAKIIIDSDYGSLGDDDQLGIMAAQLHAQGSVEVLGITVVSGSQWLRQGTADALKSMERLGLGTQIGVYAGADKPLVHDLETVLMERKEFPDGGGYLGAWATQEPRSESDLRTPPGGFALTTRLQRKSAVSFIVSAIKQHPHEVTIIAAGPLTNIALAVLQHPEIVPLIKQIIYMGGAISVSGNATANAEFNWWFDPDAAQIVIRQPIPQIMIPLDIANAVAMDKKTYNRIAHDPARQTVLTRLFQQVKGYGADGKNGFESNPEYTTSIWDAMTIAYLLDPHYATETVEAWVDVDVSFGPNDGRSVAYFNAPPAALKNKMRIVKRFDNARFFDLYVDLMTRPVPVRFSS